jgi:predicted RNA-binding Zn ribbon-like protein
MDIAAGDPADEALLVDLLNTTPVVDGVMRDDLSQPAPARSWMRERGIATTSAELTALRQVRSVLQAVVRGEQSPQALEVFLGQAALRPVATDGGLDWQLVVKSGPQAALRAVLAWDALRVLSPGRLRPCANNECRLFLLDRSKPNTARWCSMAVCGNRMKARRHYRRARSAASTGEQHDET